jgi:predicted RND superfamily exporter protein
MLRPRATVLLWAGVLVAAIFGIARLEIDTSTASFLDRTDPAWQVYQRSTALFGGDEFIVVGLDADRPYDREVLEDLLTISRQLKGVSGVRRIDSLATVPLIRSKADGSLEMSAAVASGVPSLPGEMDELIGTIRADAIAPGALVSLDERLFAINVVLDRDIDANRAQTISEIYSILDGRRVLMSGVPVFRTAVNDKTRSEVLFFVPATVGVIALVLVASFRGITAVVLPIGIGTIGSSVALGAMGALGVKLSLSTMILPSVLLALGCAYTMHGLTAIKGSRDPLEPADAFVHVARPIALSGLTTIIGFLAMATVRISAIRELATYGALGVLAITVASVTLVPAVLTQQRGVSLRSGLDHWVRNPLRDWLVTVVVRHRVWVIGTWLVGLVGVGVGIAQLQISTDIIRWFPDGTVVRSDYEEIRRRLSGITPVNVLVEAADDESVVRSDMVAVIGALSDDLGRLPEVGKAISVADPLRQLNQVFSRDSSAGFPKDDASIEQYLLLLESVEYLRDVVTSDHSSANILLRMNNNSSSEIVALGAWVDDWWRQRGASGFTVATTGIMYEFGRAEEEIAYGQIRGLLFALAAIGCVLLALLRRPLVALIALLPNAIPVAMAFGCMGLVGIPLDAATVCLGSLALGIAIDDTIHVVTGYSDERGRGTTPVAALKVCLNNVLPALVLTTVAIGVGFGVLAFSEFTLIRNLGLVTAVLVSLCLLADLTLLPALLVREGPSRGV